MNRRIISVFLVFLLLASVAMPPVNANAPPLAVIPASPVVVKLVVDGITIVVTSAVVLEIGNNIGKTWDGTVENWDKFCKGVSAWIENALHTKHWIRVTDPVGTAVMRVVYDCFNSGGSSGGKKDDKWYFEARLHHGRIEINTERMNEEQAVKEMGRGKNIMTMDEGLAKEIVNKFNKDPPNTKVLIEQHSPGKYGKEKYFDHGNFMAKDQRCHVWVWRP